MIGGARGRAVAAALAVVAAAAGLWVVSEQGGEREGAAGAERAAAGTASARLPTESPGGTSAGPGEEAPGASSGSTGDAADGGAPAADGRGEAADGPREGDGPPASTGGSADERSPDRSAGAASRDSSPPAADPSGEAPAEEAPDAQESPPDAEELVRRAAAAYDSLGSLQARFRQVLEMRVFDPPRRREGEGTWYQRKPAFLRMDFSDPEDDVIVSDGENLWLYYPSTHPGQVIRTGLASPGRGAAVVDLQGRIFRQARTTYRPEYLRREEVTGRTAHLLELVPRRPDTQYQKVRVWVDTRTYLLRKLQFHDRSETVRTITLDRLRPDVTLPDSLFRFEPPPDVEVFEG